MKRLTGSMAIFAVCAVLSAPAAAEQKDEPGAAPSVIENPANRQQPDAVEAPPIEKVEVPEKVIDQEMKGPETTVDQWREDINKMREESGEK